MTEAKRDSAVFWTFGKFNLSFSQWLIPIMSKPVRRERFVKFVTKSFLLQAFYCILEQLVLSEQLPHLQARHDSALLS